MNASRQMERRDEEGLKDAVTTYKKAILLDDDCAPAHAGLSDCYHLLADYGWRDSDEAYAMAKAEAELAIERDPHCAQAHAALAEVLYGSEFDWSGANREFQEAIHLTRRLKEDDAEAFGLNRWTEWYRCDLKEQEAHLHHWYAIFLAQSGRLDAAEVEIATATELDPISPIIQTNQGKIEYYRGNYDKAIKYYEDALYYNKDYTKAVIDLGLAHEMKGEYREALARYTEAAKESGADPQILIAIARAHARLGETDEARKALDDLRKVKQTGAKYVSPYALATGYAALGETKLAFAMLDLAWDEKDSQLSYLKIDPRLRPFTEDARFKDDLPKFKEYLKRAHLLGDK